MSKADKVTRNIQTITCNDIRDNNGAFKQNKTRSNCLPVAMIMTIVIKQHYTLFCLDQTSSFLSNCLTLTKSSP